VYLRKQKNKNWRCLDCFNLVLVDEVEEHTANRNNKDNGRLIQTILFSKNLAQSSRNLNRYHLDINANPDAQPVKIRVTLNVTVPITRQ
jgi:hypothetical protein